MTSDGHLSTRIPLFSPRNNRLVFARPTRRFRRRVSEKEKGRRGEREIRGVDGKLGANHSQHFHLQHFFFVFTSAEKRGLIDEGREIKTRIIEGDQRSEDEVYDAQGRQCNEQDWCLEASQKLFA